jgi:hypothetical protein
MFSCMWQPGRTVTNTVCPATDIGLGRVDWLESGRPWLTVVGGAPLEAHAASWRPPNTLSNCEPAALHACGA